MTSFVVTGKARRLKQAKEEANDEIEKYRQEREQQFKSFESKVPGKETRLIEIISIIRLCVF